MKRQREVYRFGASNHLIGIYHDLVDNQSQDPKPTLVCWNTGISHRIGPYGVFTDLAVRMAVKGFPSFRFDLSSLGDSDQRRDGSQIEERTMKDIKDALDFLEKKFGAKQFILVGICSGAVDAHHSAAIDPRVVGLCMIDTYVYRTPLFYFHYYQKRIWNSRRWIQFVKNRMSSKIDESEDNFEGVYPEQEEAARDLQNMINRGVRLFVAYTGGFDYLYSYQNQFLDMFPQTDFKNQLTLNQYPHADHLFMLVEHRESVLSDIEHWAMSFQQVASAEGQSHLINEINLSSLKISEQTPTISPLDSNFVKDEKPSKEPLIDSPPGETLLILIQEWESRFHEQTAIRFSDQSLSYTELKRQSDHLASILVKNNVKTGDRIAICLSRRPEMIVSILGILKAGASYVPLDSAYPDERLQYLLENSQPHLLLIETPILSRFQSTLRLPKIITIDEIFANDLEATARHQFPPISPEELAYIIYTSGSTGQPKGIAMPHRALANLIRWHSQSYPDRATTLQFAPISFDVSFQEIFSTFHLGGTLVMIEEKQRLDPFALLSVIEQQKVERIFLPFIALQYLSTEANRRQFYPSSLQDIFTAGEQLRASEDIKSFFRALSRTRLHNHYGPSESHVVTAYTLETDPNQWVSLPPIGVSLPHCQLLVVDENLHALPLGSKGELLISGVCLAKGYWQRDEETRSKFVKIKGYDGTFYRSGDLVSQLESGDFEYWGRADFQVKIRGYRVELGEIELALEKNGNVEQAIVDSVEEEGGEKSLIAFIKPNHPQFEDWSALRDALAKDLPNYMIPTRWMKIKEIPRTPSGKIDRKTLTMSYQSGSPSQIKRDLKNSSDQHGQTKSFALNALVQIYADILGIPNYSERDHFFQKGGNSLFAIRLANHIQDQFGADISVLDIFECPTPEALYRKHNVLKEGTSISRSSSQTMRKKFTSHDSSKAVAVIGMAGRFPGATSPHELWEKLCLGEELVTRFKAHELDQTLDPLTVNDPNYVPVRGIIDRYAEFDREFFKMTALEAELVDPQQRILLELAWQVLEDGGYPAPKLTAITGVYAGVGHNTYYLENVLKNRQILERAGSFQAMLANDKDYVATRIAHKLNLKGPALNINTACSTSLVAIIQAIQGLRSGQCDLAIAGGAAITSPVASGHQYTEGGIMSKDGHCRPFDAEATGTFFSDGAALVLLKRFNDAIRDGDRIYAVVQGIGLNNDGADKASFSSPSVAGQAAAIQAAHIDAAIDDIRKIEYIECHGTATPIGDPIEVEALKRVFQTGTKELEFCALGSVKGNLGHLTAAAGVTGLIKAILSCYHGTLPPSIHIRQANPHLKLVGSPFRLQTSLTPWPGLKGQRWAGVSSFGVGGTNAHLLISNAQVPNEKLHHDKALESIPRLLCASAESIASLKLYQDAIESQRPRSDRSDYAYTLNHRRIPFVHRSFTVWQAAEDSQKLTWSQNFAAIPTGIKLGFLFPGQGCQYPGMAQGLYQYAPEYRSVLVQVCREIEIELGHNILPYLIDPKSSAEEMNQTLIAQPCIFAFEYALGKQLQTWGIQPSFCIGHSIGEITAALLAEVMDLQDGIRLICHRSRLMQDLPPGGMTQVRIKPAMLAQLNLDHLSVAAINGPELYVFAGPTNKLQELERTLNEQQIPYRRLKSSHAFHSSMMQAILPEFKSRIAKLNFKQAQIPIYSTKDVKKIDASGGITMEQNYWADQIRATVQFKDTLNLILEEFSNNPVIFLEIGPDQITSRLTNRMIPNVKHSLAIPIQIAKDHADEQWIEVLKALGQIWCKGNSINWEMIPGHQGRVSQAPVYPFTGHRYWVQPDRSARQAETNDSIAEQSATQQRIFSLKTEEQDRRRPATVTMIHQEDKQQSANSYSKEGANKMSSQWREQLDQNVKQLLSQVCGISLNEIASEASFYDLGLDSLYLTQLVNSLKKEFNVEISFRKLSNDFGTIHDLTEYLYQNLPAPQIKEAPAVADQPTMINETISSSTPNLKPDPKLTLSPRPLADLVSGTHDLQSLFNQQLFIMQQQLNLLQANPKALQENQPVNHSLPPTSGHLPNTLKETSTHQISKDPSQEAEPPKTFGAQVRIEKKSAPVEARQKQNLESFIQLYNQKTQKSKNEIQNFRKCMADPRSASGFQPLFKEVTYPIVAQRSKGPYFWDIDGNRYIDLLCGYGSNFLGYQPDFLTAAYHDQLDKGYPIGPQFELVGEASALAAEMTGHERVAWCNTGSEAVLAALRMARTITGRDKVAIFEGSYHGLFDEVIVRRRPNGSPFPASSGVNPTSVQNIVILDYDDAKSLEKIRQMKDELGAVLVEPVRSRYPSHRPIAFLQDLSKLTQEIDVPLIMDEVITGFRCHPGGFQAYSGVHGDIATYGKVLGGGMPIGMVAGRHRYLDAIDGGFWQFGDSSQPESGVTYFAGTFVRHPLAIRAASEVLKYLKKEGATLQAQLNDRADQMVRTLNQLFHDTASPYRLENFGSMMMLKPEEHAMSSPFTELLPLWLRYHGLHIWWGFPSFLTTAHSESDIKEIIDSYQKSIEDMRKKDLLVSFSRKDLSSTTKTSNKNQSDTSNLHFVNGRWMAPPYPNAKLGKDESGKPAWFIEDKNSPGQFIQVVDSDESSGF